MGHVNLFVNLNQKFVISVLISRDKVTSISSKRVFDYLVQNGTTYIDSNSPNVIYVITCNRYSLQYVEETVQKLNKRFKWHKTVFNQPCKCGFVRILLDHFHKGVCWNASCSVQILEKIRWKWQNSQKCFGCFQSIQKEATCEIMDAKIGNCFSLWFKWPCSGWWISH